MTYLRIPACVLIAFFVCRPSAAQEKADSGEKPSLAWTAPSSWKQGPERMMRSVTFHPDGDKRAECSVTILAGSAGGTVANVNRWLDAIGQPKFTNEQVDNLPTIRILGKHSPFVYAAGKSDALLGTICPLTGHTVFVKLTGPKALVESERDRFFAFCRSLRPATGKRATPKASPRAASEQQDYGQLVDRAARAYRKKDYAKALEMFTEAEKALSKAVKNFSGNSYDFEDAATQRFQGFEVKDPTEEQIQFARDARALGLTHYYLGGIYSRGEGVTADPKAAFAWHLKAARERGGNSGAYWKSSATAAVANAYLEGAGVSRDYKEAFAWHQAAYAQVSAGLDGQDEERDALTLALTKSNFLDRARRLLKPLAENGNAEAQYYLGRSYHDAYARESKHSKHLYDSKKAHEWYLKSARGNFVPAMLTVGNIFARQKDFKDAFEWYVKAAKLGSTEALELVAKCYYEGEGVAKDAAKGDEWFLNSVRKDGPKLFDFAMQFANGRREGYLHGQSVPQDYKKAAQLLTLSAQLNHGRAQRALASMYAAGTGVTKDLGNAREWLWKAAANGDTDSQYLIGSIYDSGKDMFTGKTFKRDARSGFMWFSKAATRQRGPQDGFWYRPDQRAFFALGWAYFHGNGVKKDIARSRHWMRKAIDGVGDGVMAAAAKDIPTMAQKFWDENLN